LVGVVGLALLAPVWGFEILYLCGLSGEALPKPMADGVPPVMLQALWVASGEEPDAGVQALWVGNYFERSRYWERQLPGRRAITRVARLLVYRTPHRRLRRLEHHLATGAVAVWLSRHSSESELKRHLAEREYFGRGAHGVEAASQVYFGKHVSELTAAQVGVVAALMETSSRSYDCRPAQALSRRNYILGRLRDVGAITSQGFTAAVSEPLGMLPPRKPCP
jgi:hypothetical protein